MVLNVVQKQILPDSNKKKKKLKKKDVPKT